MPIVMAFSRNAADETHQTPHSHILMPAVTDGGTQDPEPSDQVLAGCGQSGFYVASSLEDGD